MGTARNWALHGRDRMDMILVFTTVDSEDAAQRLAQEAVQRHLAACVQVQAIRSTYR